jgi:2-dehydropantoate 2-reductase
VETLIAGAGAVGGYFGFVLARAGWPITLLARGERFEALRTQGLRVRSHGEEHTLQLPVVSDLAGFEEGSIDLVLATVKMPDLAPLAASLQRVLAPDGLVVALQNGLGADQLLAAELGAARVVGGAAYVGVDCPEPGLVRHIAGGRITLGALPGIDKARAARLSLHLEAAGVPCRVCDDLRALRWGKLVWNAAYNPVSALARVTVGEAADDPGLRDILRAAMEEVVAVGRAARVALKDGIVERNLTIRPEYREGLTSMRQDAEARRPNEADAILGAVLRVAAEHHVATPTLTLLHALVTPLGPAASARNPS